MNVLTGRHRIRVRIDCLRLHGFDPGEQHAIARELQTALAGLLRECGLPAGTVHRRVCRSLHTEPIRMQRQASGEGVGGQIAERVYEGLRR